MRVVGSAGSNKPRYSPTAQTFDVEAAGEEDEDISKVLFDEDLHAKEDSELLFDRQKYELSEIWPTTSQIDEVTNSLRPGSHKHEN